jgi:hypothetical protein
MLRVRCWGLRALDTMSKDTKKYIGDIIGTKVENILYFIYFLNQGSLGGMVGGTF